ncbi:F0F1 ATP synthase subunit C [Streptococcus sp. zg-86]|uniref:ATP synthase subunit c n=1 Tax=Streptococcus zhangguiae TaxID=2664091 RepID=A0A6I4RF75_9STRE|nr:MULTISPECIES: F0F1 ATP synthase subunit C [Streptococcus]MBF0786860.1 F0F1 ATP synthase subunit C [Streptococcus sp. 19428wC2_LYSM12]MCQ9212729.1 F0F1 ATP synthase subunit C [Streptococcus sp. B01]MCQ9214070.1 F0F1 ATP synthase subunit C [Streptococcus sp. O1]MTB64513.1 F0F1 ATP synthase subunit C [Streptococcus sp. zg-86]MTB90797.1 F0F1 ATP synthase subunit C [Streptococcus sp. zg-36]
MDVSALALGVACLGVSVGEGLLVASYLSSTARQPELQSKLMTGVFMGVAFIEGTFFVTLAMTLFLRG